MRMPVVAAGFLVLGLAVCLRGEEFVMKDGTRITGRIIAYKSDSFIVETSFGQAIVYKSKVASINFPSEEKPTATKPASKPALPIAKASTQAPARPPGKPESEPVQPEAPAAQQNLTERVEGTSYINETFRFRMFKPPSWRVFPGVTRGLGPAIVVMGTEDESTLLMVGREKFDGSLEAYAAASERQMARGYSDYRKLSESRITVNGLPGIRRTFMGNIDGADWYGLVSYFARGQEQFAIVGLTTGELHDFTQGLFRKVVNTFEFFHP